MSVESRTQTLDNQILLKIRDLKKYFHTPKGLVRAVDGVSFDVNREETLALVGESGSGKTTVANVILGRYTADAGSILYKGYEIGNVPLVKRDLWLRREIQVVFQDPATSLNPKKTVKSIIETAIDIHNPGLNKYEKIERLLELMDYVGLTEDHLFKLPGELGGGEKQLVAIARALATNPTCLILDESTSNLDVSAQSRILKTLLKIQKNKSLTYILITHDLAVVRNISHRTNVMYLGKIMEIASIEELFSNPLHPYTQMLLSSIPTISEEESKILPKDIEPRGEIPSAINPPSGCRFRTRCPFVMKICSEQEPALDEVSQGHYVACHLLNNSKK
ncbi:MAG: ABC transporter ATP-binding protein [Nitrososphaerota archaeon]|nr:ABC transporter ATP-binding protein [Aigarchaeota archaeon]MDW8076528.1 ABC transporter ATP-binding protein [Nitrososphaerota archaeon]